jgi:ribosomal-protein-serine acetyltransferase
MHRLVLIALAIDPLFAAVRESIAEISPWLPWCHAASGAALGGMSLNHIVRSNRLANMGYWVSTSAPGRGVASEAVKLVAAYGFKEAGLSRIAIAAIPENMARVAERAGATFEAIVRNRLVMHGKAFDAALYSLVPT